ncbi:MAG: hypothetical protein IIX93_00345, partial [Clostridia bacterium]|nr:hypothetical protein [Clostridia bacterium]
FILKNVRDEAPVFASRAIFDMNERPRPAYYALMQAWSREHAFAVCSAEGVVDGICTAQAYYVCDEGAESATVNVTAYGADGHELIGSNFPVLGSSKESVGRLMIEVGDEPFIVIRTKVVRSFHDVCVCDTVLPIGGSIYDAEETQLIYKNHGIENVGGVAAIGVSIPGANYFGAILPGERVEIEPGKPAAAEGLNILY